MENLIHFMFKHAVFMRSGKIMYICADLFVNSANGEQKMGLFVSFLMITTMTCTGVFMAFLVLSTIYIMT